MLNPVYGYWAVNVLRRQSKLGYRNWWSAEKVDRKARQNTGHFVNRLSYFALQDALGESAFDEDFQSLSDGRSEHASNRYCQIEEQAK